MGILRDFTEIFQFRIKGRNVNLLLLWTRKWEFMKKKKKKKTELANHWLQNKIITALKENVSMRTKFSFLACTGRQMYSSICLSRFVLKRGKMKSPGHYLPRDLLLFFVVLTNPRVAESCPFCLWVQAEGRNIFQNSPWDGWAPWDRIWGRTKESCGYSVKGVWIGGLSFGRHLLLPFANLK